MGHKKHRKGFAPVPPGNQPKAGPPTGPGHPQEVGEQGAPAHADGTGFQEQDPQRRLGNYGGAGEHPYVQPGGRNDADH